MAVFWQSFPGIPLYSNTWHVRAIPTYRVYRLCVRSQHTTYNSVGSTISTIYYVVGFHAHTQLQFLYNIILQFTCRRSLSGFYLNLPYSASFLSCKVFMDLALKSILRNTFGVSAQHWCAHTWAHNFHLRVHMQLDFPVQE